jgi:RNA-directed DNA polymerase
VLVMTKSYEIPKKLVWEAYQCVKANDGGAGVDRESIAQFEGRQKNNLYKLWNRMSSGSYFPPPVKGVPIPKKSGGEGMLGIQCRIKLPRQLSNGNLNRSLTGTGPLHFSLN